ncbi:MAG: AzlD domain-containing protein [Pseudomonadota bacterium]
MSDLAFLAVTLVMAGVALFTRLSGALMMSWVKPTPRVERFLLGMSVSVIAALVASALAQQASLSNTIAIGVALLAMWIGRNVIWAMAAGMLSSAALYHLGLF